MVIVKWLLILTLGVLSVFFNPSWAKNITLEVDRIHVETGDVLVLTVVANFQTYKDRPDFNLLKDQFEILGTQRSNVIHANNQEHIFSTQWIAHVIPKYSGELQIPSFNVAGAISQPKTIFVTETRAHAKQQGAPSFLEAIVNKTNVKVQEEVIYILRFYHLGSVMRGNFSPPQFDNSLVKQLRNQFNYRKQMHGKTYRVLEWTYAFYPQKSGEMVIYGHDFTGRIQSAGQIFNIQDNFKPITITVNPRARDFPANQTWLPATALTLQEEWKKGDDEEIRVGDNITRTLTIAAHGQLASQLPELNFNNQTGLQIYPDKPQTQEVSSSTGVVSQKTYTMALVPIKAGTLILPEIKVNWWNTQTLQIETSILPEKILNILPSLKDATLPPIKEVTTELSAEENLANYAIQEEGYLWKILTGIFAVLWLITLVLFFRQKIKQPKKTATLHSNVSPPSKKNFSEISKLCEQSSQPSAKIFYTTLQKEINQHPFLSKDKSLLSLTASLKGHLFNNKDLGENITQEICQVVRQLHDNNQKIQANKQNKAQLQNLYPS